MIHGDNVYYIFGVISKCTFCWAFCCLTMTLDITQPLRLTSRTYYLNSGVTGLRDKSALVLII